MGGFYELKAKRPMFQGLSTQNMVESSGIGLSMVKKIVEMYGGRIEVESEVNKGTTFTITITLTFATYPRI